MNKIVLATIVFALLLVFTPEVSAQYKPTYGGDDTQLFAPKYAPYGVPERLREHRPVTPPAIIYREPAPIVRGTGALLRGVAWPFRPTYYVYPAVPYKPAGEWRYHPYQ